MRPLIFLLVAGCAWVGDSRYDEIQDLDGDGFVGERFGGPDCADDDPTIHDCDVDGDGFDSVAAGGDDCDDADGTLNPETVWYADADQDGVGGDSTFIGCAPPPNFVLVPGDCDDARDDVAPGLPEFCDTIDHNCDGDPEEGAVDVIPFYADNDGDGWGGAESGRGCTLGANESLTPGDCDDNAGGVYPGAPEVCYDGIDDNCDGSPENDCDNDGVDRDSDCDDTREDIFPGADEICDGLDNDCDGDADDADSIVVSGTQMFYADVDGDLFGDPGVMIEACAAPSDYVDNADDCNDRSPSVNPDGTEACDLIDNDCNGTIDDWGAAGASIYYVDSDGDGYGNSAAVLVCRREAGLVTNSNDCNDADPSIYPGAPEVCGDNVRQDCSAAALDDCDGDGTAETGDCDDGAGHNFPGNPEVCDGLDNDCDGDVDGDDASLESGSLPTWYRDDDGDGFGQDGDTLVQCEQPEGFALVGGDCDDDDDALHPDADEVCDGVDNNCDGSTDRDPVDPPVFYYDNDRDGVGNTAVTMVQDCFPLSSLWVAVDGDCDDDDANVQDSRWYTDADGDGYGVASTEVMQCEAPSGMVAGPSFDCNDQEASVNPGAGEVCDGLDNDCDGAVDNGVQGAATWYEDLDNDSYGDPDTSQQACTQPAGWVPDSSDCDPRSSDVHPGASELCDGFDNDCDGLVDDDDTVNGGLVWFADVDDDGYGDADSSQIFCSPQVGWVLDARDCDDDAGTVFPGADELCDGLDNDCDSLVDDLDTDSQPIDGTPWYEDGDTDGFVSASPSLRACTDPGGYSPTPGLDCDDSTGTISPNATETWYDGIDSDCDGLSDYDQDGDSYDDDSVSWGTDCLDTDPLAYPGADEIYYNDVDNDCAGGDDHDADGDTYAAPSGSGSDCDDSDPAVYPGAADSWYDGVDGDCAGDSDFDQDGDGQDSELYGGVDCDDADEFQFQYTAANPLIEPSDLQAELDRVCSGSVLHLGDGFTYFGSFDIGAKTVVIERVAGATGTTTLDARGEGPNIRSTGGDLILRDVTLINGVSGFGGALNARDSTILFDGVTITGPAAADRGGAIYAVDTDLTVQTSTIDGARAYGTADAAVYTSRGRLTVDTVDLLDLSNRGIETSGTDVVVRALTADTTLQARITTSAALHHTGGSIDLADLHIQTKQNSAIVVDETSSFALRDSQLFGEPHNASGQVVYVRGAGPVSIDDCLIGGAATAVLVAGGDPVRIEQSTLYGRGGGNQTALTTFAVIPAMKHNIFLSQTGSFAGTAWSYAGPASASFDVTYNVFETAIPSVPGFVGTIDGNQVTAPSFVSYHPNLAAAGDDYDFELRRTPFDPSNSAGFNQGEWGLTDADGSRIDAGYWGGLRADGTYWADSDADGMPDGWEARHGLVIGTDDSAGDGDVDNCSNLCEYLAGSDPAAVDTDGDATNDDTDGSPLDPTVQ